MDHITNDTSLIGPCDVIPVGGRNERFPVVGHRENVIKHFFSHSLINSSNFYLQDLGSKIALSIMD